MPALKMIAKLSKTCKREGGFPHVSQKSNKISKMPCSLVRVTHDPADLDTSTQTFQDGSSKNGAISEEHKNDENWMSCNGHETMLETCLSQDEDSDSIEKTDISPSCLSSSLGIMFSPSTVPSEANCNPVGAVQREQNAIAPQVDDDNYGHRSNNNSVFQTSNVVDSSVYEMCLAGFSTDRISASDYVNYDIFSDHELHGTNMIYDAAEGFPFFPFPEETIDAVDSLYGGSCEEFQQISDYSWFHSVCQQTMPFNQEVDDDLFHFNSREVDYSDAESFIRNFPELSDDSDSLPALVSKETSKRKHVTLVLDLDETLVHSTLEPCNGADFTIQVFFNKKEHTVYVRQRPFLKSFLERASQMFEIIIFTASQSIYAEKVLDILDPKRELFSRQVYRESCIYLDGSYAKDLTVLGIDLAKVVIIDNSPQVFRLQVHNGIPIKSWFDDPSDNALNSLLPFLETLVDVDDVRPIIAKKFGVNS